jgi:hypothetical protein
MPRKLGENLGGLCRLRPFFIRGGDGMEEEKREAGGGDKMWVVS